MATDRLGNYSTARLLFGAHDARKRYAACHGRMRLATRMWIMAVGLGHGRPALGMVLTSPEEIAGPLGPNRWPLRRTKTGWRLRRPINGA